MDDEWWKWGLSWFIYGIEIDWNAVYLYLFMGYVTDVFSGIRQGGILHDMSGNLSGPNRRTPSETMVDGAGISTFHWDHRMGVFNNRGMGLNRWNFDRYFSHSSKTETKMRSKSQPGVCLEVFFLGGEGIAQNQWESNLCVSWETPWGL